jgi:AcrR family transcriptional regulator
MLTPYTNHVGRPARISRDQILDAALAVADEEGLEAVTMQTVAKRLAVTPMALYRHVEDKKDLLDGLVERLLTEVPLPAASLAGNEWLAALAHNLRATAARHPHVFPLLLQRPAMTPAALAVRQGALDALGAVGLGPDEAARAERLLSTAILGFAASEASGRFARHERAVVDADFEFLLMVLRQVVEAGGAANGAANGAAGRSA